LSTQERRLYNVLMLKNILPPFSYKTVFIFLFFLIGGWSSGFCDSSQAWLTNAATFSLSPRFDLKISHHGRFLDITYSNPYLKNIQGGIVFKLTNDIYFATLYRRDHVVKDIIYNENRFTFEAGWKTKLAEKLDFDIRIRTEIREFEEEFPEDHLRFRFRVRIKTELSIGKLKLKPFIANETFGKTKIYTVQNNRFFVGTMIPLGEHVEFGLSYIWLTTRDAESIHILHSGFELKF
jgi:hypothetical protein